MTDLAQAQKLMKMADLLAPSAIRAAATIRVADHIAAGSTQLAELAGKTGTQEDILDILLRYLVDLGLLEHGQGGFGLTPLGEPLLDAYPAGVRESLAMDGLFGRADVALVNILHTVRTGEASHGTLFGRGYWDSVNEDPEFLGAIEKTGTELGWDAGTVIDSYDWSGVSRVVDVGGHNGALMTALAQRHTHLHGTVVDLKNLAEAAAKNLAAAGLSGRCEAVVGSFFDPLPIGGDVYLLSAVLADWKDDDAITILRRCGEAAGAGGKVLLAEVSIEASGAAIELYVRATMPAPVRTVDELKALGAAAGLRVSWEGPVTSVRSLLEFELAEVNA